MKQYTLKPFESAKSDLQIDYAKELNPEQLAVVTDVVGPCLVLAGAGSGKTRTLVYRVAYMIEQGISPERILLMTFTNKAANEMLNRIEVLLKAKPKGLWGGTFHHVGNRILRMYGSAIGIGSDFTILDQEDSRDLIKACLAELDFPKDRYFPKAEAILKVISLGANASESAKETIESRFSYLDESVIPKIESVAKRYTEKKVQSNSLDYDDLLGKWNQLLKEKDDIREKLARKFSYILVDEYQDTNFIQAQIVRQLAGPLPNVLAVGDDSQSIYSFRGATVHNILQFPKIFENTKTFKLETNYRSTPEILKLANASIKHNINQFDKTLSAVRPSSDKPVVASLSDAAQQADFVCQRILELQQDEGISLSDIAVLFRAHYQVLEVEMEMNKRNIPYEMRGGLRFFEQAHIKDIVAHLKAYTNVQDEISWTRILNLQEGIGTTGATKIWKRVATFPDITHAISANIAESLPSRAAIGWQRLITLLDGMTGCDTNNVGALIQQVFKSGYDRHVAANFDNAQDRLDDITQLIDFAGRYDSLEKFLSDVALSEGFKGQTIVGEGAGPDEAVTLSTIHQAKGLEWKVVFVIGLTDGQFPHAKVFEHPDQMEEERRLFYVASTRAKEKLYLTYPLISGRGDLFSRVSQFLQELPESTFERWDVDESSGYRNLDDGEVRYVDEDGESEGGGILDVYLRQRGRK